MTVSKEKPSEKIKIGGEGDRKQSVTKKPVTLKIKVVKIEYGKESTALRVSGTVEEGPEDVPLGSHHTITLEENTTITIQKNEWLQFQIDKIKEASQELQSKILICVHDREEAYFALMKKYGYTLLSTIKGNVQKKADLEKVEGNFYKTIIKQLIEYDKKYKFQTIVIGSPAFWKEDLMKELNDPELKKKTILATCSSVGENGIHEVLKRPETEEALKQDRIAKEFKLVEELFEEIAKENLAAYGQKETKQASDAGAIKTLLLTDNFIQEQRDKDEFQKTEAIMKDVDKSKGSIVIVSSDHEAGKKLHGMGGIAAILRYKIK